jgi:glycosyltransferase involved in cell wall biosynthesis
MRLHVIGLAHTVVSQRYSHCAFTGKVLRFARMMRPFGYEVVEYSNGTSESGANVHVQILTEEELASLSRRTSESEDYSADVNNAELTQVFADRTLAAITAVARAGEIVCHVFGPSEAIMGALPSCVHVESGIGYTCTHPAAPYRIYESAAWMHWHYGRRHMEFGANYEFVAPNYYDAREWVPSERVADDAPVLFFGRVTSSKGLDTVVEAATRMPATRFVVCGQGDPTPWAGSATNVEFVPPVFGEARAALLASAAVLIAPTSFIEPFCGSAVEAQMCGTPVVSTAFGAFHETVEPRRTGYLCHTLADFVAALGAARGLDRAYVARRARQKYSLEAVGAVYHAAFTDILGIARDGWYGSESSRYSDRVV